MKDLQELTGAKILGKKEQQSVKGGISIGDCSDGSGCPDGWCCSFSSPYYGKCIKADGIHTCS